MNIRKEMMRCQVKHIVAAMLAIHDLLEAFEVLGDDVPTIHYVSMDVAVGGSIREQQYLAQTGSLHAPSSTE